MSREFIEDGLDWSWRRERVLRAMADPAVNVVVAHDGRTLTGFGIMEYGDLHAHLALLAVAPPYRQRRVGSRLVAWLEQPARIAGLEKVRLEARADNPGALLFYRRLGFEATGRAAGYNRGEIDAVRFEKSLRLG
jgi:ribosomal protein S18 acetylase RimI-like enzyme